MTPEERKVWEQREAEIAKLPHRALRGGGWMGPNVDCARRFGRPEKYPQISIGFRLALSPPEPKDDG